MKSLFDGIGRADCVIVVPPFGGIDRPNLGVHLLQACAKEQGMHVAIVYANILLAARIGELPYESICYAPTTGLVGERMFAALAYGLPTLGRNATRRDDIFKRVSRNVNVNMSYEELCRIESQLAAWLGELVAGVLALGAPVVGCTTTFEQTSASIAILNEVKRQAPDRITIMGGANCEGEMAHGILSLGPAVDHVFAGESEATFPAFLSGLLNGGRRPERVIEGGPNRALDRIPTPSFAEYYRQLKIMPEGPMHRTGNLWLPYETSRGCWWGEKRHCTFCGINGQGMAFRQKSADRVITELKTLLQVHPTRNICMVDNIMPFDYFDTLLPRLRHEVGDTHIFYEQKANLSFERVGALKHAGVAVIQPGIEALSTPLLKLMRKGVTADQNVRLLRFARAVDLSVNWNLLYAFPTDQGEWFEDTLRIIPFLEHLNPPTGVFHLSIDRFSPYFDAADSFGLSQVRPVAEYFDVFPDHADVPKLAYHFEADYQSHSKDDRVLIDRLKEAVERWRQLWSGTDGAPPLLELTQLSPDEFLLADSRSLATQQFHLIGRRQAKAVLHGTSDPELCAWAKESNFMVTTGTTPIMLATAPYELFTALAEANPSPMTVAAPS